MSVFEIVDVPDPVVIVTVIVYVPAGVPDDPVLPPPLTVTRAILLSHLDRRVTGDTDKLSRGMVLLETASRESVIALPGQLIRG